MTTYEQLLQEGEQMGLQKGEQMGLQKGEQIGLQKGEQIGLQKGAGRVLARQLHKRFDMDVEHLTLLLNALSPEQQDELSEKILVAQSLEEIHQWLKSVCSH
jgi:predicted transposase YdaD